MCFIINFLSISFAHLGGGFLVFFLLISEIFWLIRNTKRLKVPCVGHGMQNWASGPKRNGEGWTELAWFGRLPKMDEEEGDVRMIPKFLAWAVLSLEKLFTESRNTREGWQGDAESGFIQVELSEGHGPRDIWWVINDIFPEQKKRSEVVWRDQLVVGGHLKTGTSLHLPQIRNVFSRTWSQRFWTSGCELQWFCLQETFDNIWRPFQLCHNKRESTTVSQLCGSQGSC